MTLCGFHDDVSQAALTGRWTNALSAHAETCDGCREVRLVVMALQANPVASGRPSTDPSALWACGRHARRIATETQINLVVTATEIGVLLGVLGVVMSYIDWRAVWATATALTNGGAAAVAVVAVVGVVYWASAMMSDPSHRSST